MIQVRVSQADPNIVSLHATICLQITTNVTQYDLQDTLYSCTGDGMVIYWYMYLCSVTVPIVMWSHLPCETGGAAISSDTYINDSSFLC